MSLDFLLSFMNFFGVLNIERNGEGFRTSKLQIVFNILKILALFIGKNFIYRYAAPFIISDLSLFKNYAFSTQLERKYWGMIVIMSSQILMSSSHVKMFNRIKSLHESLQTSQLQDETTIRNRNVKRSMKIFKATWLSVFMFNSVALVWQWKTGKKSDVRVILVAFLLTAVNLTYSSLFLKIMQFIIYAQECLIQLIKQNSKNNQVNDKESILAIHSEIFNIKRSFQKVFNVPLAVVLCFYLSQVVLQVRLFYNFLLSES
jgi:hypothetical protein